MTTPFKRVHLIVMDSVGIGEDAKALTMKQSYIKTHIRSDLSKFTQLTKARSR